MRKGAPRVSIIIPTFNRLWTLPDAIESVLAQTYREYELIVVDDGSTDGTGGWFHETIRDDRVRYIKKENGGVSSARNVGIQSARGQYIAFLDSDDQYLPPKLERQVAVMDRGHPVSYTDEIWIRNGRRVNPKKKHQKYGGDIFIQSLPLVIISPSSVMLRRSVIDEVGLFDESMPACEDYDLWLRLTSRFPVFFINEPLIVKFGGHTDQLSRRYWGLDMLRIYALEKLLDFDGLDDGKRNAVIFEIMKKARVVRGGAKKRGNEVVAALYGEKIKMYERELSDDEP
jgi:glycosyltransferase involved in cell wall biosynthesis